MSLTPLCDVIAPVWLPLGSAWVSAEPLRASDGGYAHLSYRDALAAVEALGAELPTRADMLALRDASIILDPVILPDPAMVHAAMRPGDTYDSAAQRAREACMMGPVWAALHDTRVQAQLDAIGWDATRPVFNIGKPPIAGASPGRCRIMGWWLPAQGRWIQDGVYPPGCHEFHDDRYGDYSGVVVAVRREAP